MIRVEVNQGGNRIRSVFVTENDLGVICVLINSEKRWCEWTTGCSGLVDGTKSEDFFLCDRTVDVNGESITLYGDTSEIKLWHNGELDKKYQITNQEKDQLCTYYLPYELVEDGEILATWENNDDGL